MIKKTLILVFISYMTSTAQNISEIKVEGDTNKVTSFQSSNDTLNKSKIDVKGKRHEIDLKQIHNEDNDKTFFSKYVNNTYTYLGILASIVTIVGFIFRKKMRK